MVIEAKDGLFDSIRNGIHPVNAIARGQRTLSPFSERTEIIDMGLYAIKLTLRAETDDSLHCFRQTIRSTRGISNGYGEVFRKERINDPDLPWHGRILWREGETTQNNP